MRAAVCALLLAGPAGAGQAGAGPAFVPEPGAITPPHEYTGGWEHFVGGGVAVFDCDGDARPDLFAAGGESPAALYRNRSAPGGALAFAAAPLPGDLTGVTGAYPLDLDSDGVMDLAVLRVGANRLLRGLGGCAFEEATAALGLDPGAAWTTAFSATWEAGAPLPTLFFGNYVDRENPDGPFEACDANLLFRGTAPRYTAPERIEPGWCTLSALFSDWARQGAPELRLSNDRQYYVRGGHEQMFTLTPLAERADWPKVSLWGMGIASRDITGDGLPEVMMTSMGDQLLQINTGTGFTPAPYALGTYAQRPYQGDDGRPSTGWTPVFGDVDNDGRDDLFIAKGNVDQMPSNASHDPDNLLMQGPDGRFTEAGGAAGVASTARGRGAALVDLNADGRLDLVVSNRRAPLMLSRNVTEGSGHWLEIAPRQAGVNPDAVGAWVEVRAGGRVRAQEVTVGGGHAGGVAGPLHFGLGPETAAEVRVIWPGGAVSEWRAVPVDQRLEITRP